MDGLILQRCASPRHSCNFLHWDRHVETWERLSLKVTQKTLLAGFNPRPGVVLSTTPSLHWGVSFYHYWNFTKIACVPKLLSKTWKVTCLKSKNSFSNRNYSNTSPPPQSIINRQKHNSVDKDNNHMLNHFKKHIPSTCFCKMALGNLPLWPFLQNCKMLFSHTVLIGVLLKVHYMLHVERSC